MRLEPIEGVRSCRRRRSLARRGRHLDPRHRLDHEVEEGAGDGEQAEGGERPGRRWRRLTTRPKKALKIRKTRISWKPSTAQ